MYRTSVSKYKTNFLLKRLKNKKYQQKKKRKHESDFQFDADEHIMDQHWQAKANRALLLL